MSMSKGTAMATKSDTTKASTSVEKKALKKAASSKPKKPKLKDIALKREPLSAAGESREWCQGCGLSAHCGGAVYQMPRVPDAYSRNVVVVTGGNEDGRERQLLRRLWRRAGWKDIDVACVPAVRCAGGDPSMAQIRACRPFLLQVLHVLKPKNIIGVGKVALRALRNDGETNITKNIGKRITVPGL